MESAEKQLGKFSKGCIAAVVLMGMAWSNFIDLERHQTAEWNDRVGLPTKFYDCLFFIEFNIITTLLESDKFSRWFKLDFGSDEGWIVLWRDQSSDP